MRGASELSSGEYAALLAHHENMERDCVARYNVDIKFTHVNVRLYPTGTDCKCQCKCRFAEM